MSYFVTHVALCALPLLNICMSTNMFKLISAFTGIQDTDTTNISRFKTKPRMLKLRPQLVKLQTILELESKALLLVRS